MGGGNVSIIIDFGQIRAPKKVIGAGEGRQGPGKSSAMTGAKK